MQSDLQKLEQQLADLDLQKTKVEGGIKFARKL